MFPTFQAQKTKTLTPPTINGRIGILKVLTSQKIAKIVAYFLKKVYNKKAIGTLFHVDGICSANGIGKTMPFFFCKIVDILFFVAYNKDDKSF